MGGRKGQIAWNKKEPIKKICRCGKVFYVPPSLNRVKSCSYSCARKGKEPWNKGQTAQTDTRVAQYGKNGSLARKGKPLKHHGQFRKGHIPWNYKGDEVRYSALHDRVERLRGKASEHQCFDCGQQAKEWSSIDGKYGTDVYKDFQPRCASCHRKYDKGSYCKRGHEYNQKNTYIDKSGARQCRRCKAKRENDRRKRGNAII